jgi:tetratricopeptide (TPR) repeat protein
MPVRAILDPVGTALLTDLTPASRAWPLSLDPPPTRADLGKAALAIAIFIAVYHVASGRRRRHLFVRAVGAAGVAAVTIGIGHRLAGVPKIYGILVSTHRTLLTGPFVNANHTAEFLELGAFTCLACSFLRPTMLNRACWLMGTILCAGGVTLTLSRGGVAALCMGALMFTFLRYFAKEEGTINRRRASLIWGAFVLGLIVLGAAALGAGQLIDRFYASSVTSDVRFNVWRESLRALRAHPFGIGRGAFDRVFPIYRTLKTPFALRFAFVENEPLQLLLDCGWLGFALLAFGLGMIVWKIGRFGRRDHVEAALVAGLFAVLVHNLVDFGLETPGVLLPFMGVLATVLARIGPAAVPPWGRWLATGLVAGGCLAGIASIVHPSYDDFDVLLARAHAPNDQRAVLVRARQAHPIDYFYTLIAASLAPIRGSPGERSPRFHTLNQALALCPNCEDVHLAIARNLWSMGLRTQALLEYRSSVELQPRLFHVVMGELFQAGARAAELTSIATFDPARMIELARFLAATGRVQDGLTALNQAEALGSSPSEILLARATLELQSNQVARAQATISTLREKGVRDARLALLEVRATLAADPTASDRALALLDAAAARYPSDVDLQAARVEVVIQNKKWAAAERALEGYKQALYVRDGVATEGHIASARTLAQMGRWTDALGEYRIALADQPNNVALWLEFGDASASAGRVLTQREAYSTAARLSPNSPEIAAALRKLDERSAPTNDSSPLTRPASGTEPEKPLRADP